MRTRAMASRNAPPRLAIARPLVQRALRAPGRPITTGAGYSLAQIATRPAPHEPQPTLTRIGSRHDAAETAAERNAAHATTVPLTAWSMLDRQAAPVRIHTGSAANEAAAALGADAFALGNHIVFGRDRFRPETAVGRHLLAHELAHVAADEPGVLRRYESFEHKALGDRYLEELRTFLATEEGGQWAQKAGFDAAELVRQMQTDPGRPGQKIQLQPGLSLTPGEIIALMGDFFGSWQALANASPGELRAASKAGPDAKPSSQGILDVIDEETRQGHATAAGNIAYERITHGRYTELALHNRPHFAPENKTAWQKMHEEAAGMAKAAGPGPDTAPAFQQALLVDAAGGHFLTDAFAAGHLIDVLRVEAEIIRYLRAHPIRPANAEMQTVATGLDVAGLAEKLVLKNIHDRLNGEGFEVTNARGMRWKTFGDNALKNAVETQRLAALAIFLSRMQIVQARAGKPVNSDEILALLPDEKSVQAATQQAIAYIPQAVQDVPSLIGAQVGMVRTRSLPAYLGGPVLPYVGASLLENIADPGRERQLLDLQRQSEETGSGPRLAPQFRVLTW